MGVGSGLGGSVGLAEESTYGTYVAPTRFLGIEKADLKKVKNTVQGGGLAAGRLVQPGLRRVVTSEGGTGSIDIEVVNKNMGILLRHLMGGNATAVQQGASAAYLQTHPLADNVGKFLTVQAGVPDVGGTVRPYTFKGCKVTSAEFSCSVDSLLTANVGLDVRQVSEVETLAAPSFSTAVRPFHFAQMAVKVGAFGAEASVAGVKGVSVKIERGQSTDRFHAGAAGLKAEPIMNDWVKISGSLDTELLDKTIFHDRYASDANASLIFEWVGPIIASTYAETFRIKVPMSFFDGDTPVLDGPGLVSGSIPFVGQYDLTNAPATIEYLSPDMTV